jgi:hypothetical protein
LGTLKSIPVCSTCVKGTIKNFAAFLKDSDAPTSTEKEIMDFAYRIISKMLNLVPTDMQIANLTFKLDDNGKKQQ